MSDRRERYFFISKLSLKRSYSASGISDVVDFSRAPTLRLADMPRRPLRSFKKTSRKSLKPKSTSSLAFRPGRLGSPWANRPLQQAVHTFDCAAAQSYSYYPITGLSVSGYAVSGAGQSLNLVCDQTGFKASVGGGGFVQHGGTFDNYASYQAIYDQYRITRMSFDIYFSANSNGMASGAGLPPFNSFPMLYIVTDQNDATALASVQNALAYSSCRVLQMGNSSGANGGRQTHTVPRPTVKLGTLTTTSLLLSSTVAKSPWIDCVNSTAEHFGVKMYIDPTFYSGTGATCIGEFVIIARARFQYKNVK